MNVYMKNYAIWIGGANVFLYLVNYLNILPFGLIEVFSWLILMGGVIVGTVMTHKELGKNIEFGKAIGPVLLIIGAFSVLGILMSVINYGMEFFSYFIAAFLVQIFIKLVIGVSVLLAAGTWYMFEKAGKPGWGFLVPIYNIILMCEIGKKPTWYVAMIFVPIANIVFLIMIFDGISKSFGKDSGFTVGLVFLRQIFFAILGYGDAQYVDGPTSNNNTEVLDDI
mgnify:CR=1 FL=1